METPQANTALSYIQWNSYAVSLLEKGNLDGSIHNFKNALGNLRSFLSENEEMQRSQEDDANMISLTDDDDDDSPLIVSIPVLQKGENTKALFQDNLLSFYPRAFCLTDSAWNTSQDLKDSYSHHLVVLLYNMAMACHMEAVRQKHAAASASASCQVPPRQVQQKNYHQLLHQALTLYKAALEITDTFWSEQDFEEFQCLLVAIVNNMGYIHSEQMDFQGAKSCIRLVVDLVTGGESACPTFTAAMPDEDYELFVESIFIYLGSGSSDQVLCIAPAA